LAPPSTVTLREITEHDRGAIETLAVTSEQSHYVASVAESLAEAAQHPDARPWYRAVYADQEPVGFVMISDGITVSNPDYLGPYYLWRLIVDERFQGHGYGTRALDLVVAHLRNRPDARVLLTSHVVGPASPRGFYLRYGFRPTDRVHDGEPVLEYEIDPV
jgi:diamine N-acetyltransferase